MDLEGVALDNKLCREAGKRINNPVDEIFSPRQQA